MSGPYRTPSCGESVQDFLERHEPPETSSRDESGPGWIRVSAMDRIIDTENAAGSAKVEAEAIVNRLTTQIKELKVRPAGKADIDQTSEIRLPTSSDRASAASSSQQAGPSTSNRPPSRKLALTRPIVAVIGTTGVGKSQFAVDLAQFIEEFNPLGEPDGRPFKRAKVLSADSMQLYRGLPVITNKVTEAEMGGVEHWGLDVIEPGVGKSWEIGRWCQEALKEVTDTPDDCLPIICGGTHYYTQHFLFPPSSLSQSRPDSRVSSTTMTDEQAGPSFGSRWVPPGPIPAVPINFDSTLLPFLQTFHLPEPTYPHTVSPVKHVEKAPLRGSEDKSPEQLLARWELLRALDPAEAGRWHWKDGRKVKRGIERWWETRDAAARAGRFASRAAPGLTAEVSVDCEDDGDGAEERDSDGEARFRTLIFWVYEDPEATSPRLDKRVDQMVELGLLKEIKELREKARVIYGSEDSVDYQEGIFQSIGYKEFASIQTSDLSVNHPSFVAGIDRMKLSTRQYAKSQLKWIRKQLLPAVARARRLARNQGEDDPSIQIFVVRGGDKDRWAGQRIMREFLAGGELPKSSEVGHPQADALLAGLDATADMSAVLDISGRQTANAQRVCEICSTPVNPVSIIQTGWEAHLASKGHRRLVNRESDAERDERIAKLRSDAAVRKACREQSGDASAHEPPAKKAKTMALQSPLPPPPPHGGFGENE